MNFHPAFYFVPALFGVGLAMVVLFRERQSLPHRLFTVGVLALSIESALSGFCVASIGTYDMLWLQKLRILSAGILPAVWTGFSIVYARGNYSSFLRRWAPALLVLAIVPLIAVLFWQDLIQDAALLRFGDVEFRLGWPSMALNVALLVGSVLTLMNLERTLKASVGTMRWQIKFMLLGVGVIFAARIYTSSQVILFRSTTLTIQLINSAAFFIGGLLLLRALTRSGIFKVDVYPSERFLQYSVTGALTGAYLLVVGLFARIVTALGGEEAFALRALVILVSLVLLAILLVSERMRLYIRDFVARNFTRSRYDYRVLWLNLTERTASIMDADKLAEAVAKWVSETLHCLSVTIWLIDEKTGQMRMTSSTCFTEVGAERLPASEQQALVQNLQGKPNPFILEDTREEWVKALQGFYGDYFKTGGSRVCVPLISSAKFLGMITLGDRVNGARYGTDELDLLKCIGDQLASNLLNIRLSSELVHARELEAFQTISAFFVHDLKNTASTLNLMLQNFRVHFDNPDFREDALRAIAKTTNHIQELIRRLSLFRQKLELNSKPTDLNEVIRAAKECLVGKKNISLTEDFGALPLVSADAEQLHKVVTNLLMNASEAVNGKGEIRVQTCQQNGWAIISVSDNGCGMSPEYVRQNLFRPFHSTKKGGLGIGMYHTRMIVEAHRGKIEVESTPGTGTSFRVLLPTH